MKVKVEGGWITLEGELQWNSQKEAATSAVKNLLGVTGVSNGIKVKSQIEDSIEKAAIQSALKRNWSIYNKNIDFAVSGHKVILTGTVDSFYQKTEAERIAYNAPGVWAVENELIVDYDYALMDV